MTASQRNKMIVILMGVSGVGKTTIGRALAEDLNCRFADADDYHPAANIAKMHAGIPLTDSDRAPWLQALRNAISDWLASGENVVLACSALKASYRKLLVVSPEVKLVFLRAAFELVAARLAERKGHYMDPHLLRSQVDTLEAPADTPTFDAGQPIAQVVREIRATLNI